MHARTAPGLLPTLATRHQAPAPHAPSAVGRLCRLHRDTRSESAGPWYVRTQRARRPMFAAILPVIAGRETMAVALDEADALFVQLARASIDQGRETMAVALEESCAWRPSPGADHGVVGGGTLCVLDVSRSHSFLAATDGHRLTRGTNTLALADC